MRPTDTPQPLGPVWRQALCLQSEAVMPCMLRVALLSPLGVLTLVLAACGGSSARRDERPCDYAGETYEAGESFPAQDGCNTCGCEPDGKVTCTLLGCDSCEDVSDRYANALDEAKACDPGQPGQCSKLVIEGLACGCQTFVNAGQSEAIAAASLAQQQYTELSCGGGIACGPCLAPISAYCSAAGRCQPIFDGQAGAGCKVNGIVYESGATGIPDPSSCNECACSDGQLSCTEIGCPIDCPPDSVYEHQCAECGPADDCKVVEYGCLPVCEGTCQQGACVDRVCKSLCG